MLETYSKGSIEDFHPKQDFHDRLFTVLLLASLVLGFLWLDKPDGALIFDEKYYVNVARNILKLPHDLDVYPDATPGLDPNREHPFLAKGIIAFSILISGDNAWGWRTPSVIFGNIGLFVFYLLVKRLSNRGDMALFASFLLFSSNLLFVHSRIATLDIFMVTFMLLGFYWYTVGRRYLSAFSLALATLSKVAGLYGFFAIVVFHYVNLFVELRRVGNVFDWRTGLVWLRDYASIYVASGLLLLTIFDRIWVGYSNPLDHIVYIYSHYGSLTRGSPEGIESYPWQWLINEARIPYLTVNVDVYADSKLISSRPSVAFQGAMNPFIIYLAIPAIVYSVYSAYKKGSRIAIFTATWFALTYLPFYPMSIIGHRIMYLFYFLPALPSVCLSVSYLFLDRRTDRIVLLAYSFAVLLGFVMLFPFRQIP